MKKHQIIVGSFFACSLLLLILLWRGLGIDPQKVSPNLGTQARPLDITFYNTEKKLTRETLRDRPLIINFWASWCASCRLESQVLETFWQEHQDQDIVVLGIAIQDDLDAALSVTEKLKKTYPIGFDANGNVAMDYGVTGVPETFFINKKGVVVHKETGPMTKEVLEKNWNRLKG